MLNLLVPQESECDVGPDSMSSLDAFLEGLEWFCGKALQGGPGVEVPAVAPGVTVPEQFLYAVGKHITTLLKASEAGDSKAGDKLLDVLDVLATPTDAAPEGRDRLTVVSDFDERTGTVYPLSRNSAYTVGRKKCGNGIELDRKGCDHLGASVLTALLIPALKKKCGCSFLLVRSLLSKYDIEGTSSL